VDWEVLESSSPALQASAIPSQLPVHLRHEAVGLRPKIQRNRISDSLSSSLQSLVSSLNPATKKPGVTLRVTPGCQRVFVVGPSVTFDVDARVAYSRFVTRCDPRIHKIVWPNLTG
jgi:hypothetical protein